MGLMLRRARKCALWLVLIGCAVHTSVIPVVSVSAGPLSGRAGPVERMATPIAVSVRMTGKNSQSATQVLHRALVCSSTIRPGRCVRHSASPLR